MGSVCWFLLGDPLVDLAWSCQVRAWFLALAFFVFGNFLFGKEHFGSIKLAGVWNQNYNEDVHLSRDLVSAASNTKNSPWKPWNLLFWSPKPSKEDLKRDPRMDPYFNLTKIHHGSMFGCPFWGLWGVQKCQNRDFEFFFSILDPPKGSQIGPKSGQKYDPKLGGQAT